MSDGEPTRVVVVVPCFNEEHRLDDAAFTELAGSGGLRLLFVDDGSTDGTADRLERLRRASAAIDVLRLPDNRGKAEAVRLGLGRAIETRAEIVGYFDADLATPGDELLRLIRTLTERSELNVVLGSRVAILGSDIRRSPFRHYTGRVFATFASLALGIPVYDTQCGAKVFRVNQTLVAAVGVPFRSAWAFDVALFQRLLDGTESEPGLAPDTFLEVPLRHWRDTPGSKVDVAGSARALGDVVAMVVARYVLRRRDGRGQPVRGGPVRPEHRST